MMFAKEAMMQAGCALAGRFPGPVFDGLHAVANQKQTSVCQTTCPEVHYKKGSCTAFIRLQNGGGQQSDH